MQQAVPTWCPRLRTWCPLQYLRKLLFQYDTFHSNCHTPKIHRIETRRFFSISRYNSKLGFGLNLNLYRKFQFLDLVELGVGGGSISVNSGISTRDSALSEWSRFDESSSGHIKCSTLDPPDPMNHVKIFKGWPLQDAPWKLVELWYKSFPPGRFLPGGNEEANYVE